MSLAALTMLLVAVASGRLRRLARLPRRELLVVLPLGLCGYFLSPYLSINGLRFLPAAISTLLANSSPLWVALFTPIFLRAWPSRRALLGLVAGFSGVVVLAGSKGDLGSAKVPVIGLLLTLGAGATWAIYTALGRWTTSGSIRCGSRWSRAR